MTVAILLQDEALIGPSLRWPLRLALEAGRELVVVVPGLPPKSSTSTTALEPSSNRSSTAGQLGERLGEALDAILGADAWCPRPSGERAKIPENEADARAALPPVEVQLRVTSPEAAIEETIAQLDEPDSDFMLVTLQDAAAMGQEDHRRLAAETFCAGAFVVPGKREEDGEILVTLSDGPHPLAGLALAHELAQTHERRLTGLWVEPDIGRDAMRVGRRLLDRMLDGNLGADAREVARRVEVDDKPARGILRACQDARFEVVVLGASRLSVRGATETQVPGHVARGTDQPTVVVARAVVPRRTRARYWVDFQMRRQVPQLQREERTDLVARIQSQSQWNFDFVLMMGLSTLIAALGLLDDSVAVIIGAMLVAPLMTPLLGLGLSLAQGNPLLAKMTLKTTLLGFLTAFGIALVVGLLDPEFHQPTAEMYSRDWPTMLDLGIAFVSGLAAAYASGRTGLLAALPGVAIAAALLPPVAVSGLAVSLGQLPLAAGALLLFGVNMVAIVLASAVAHHAVGIRSDYRKDLTTRILGAGLTLVAIAMMVGIVLAPPPSTPPHDLVEAVTRVLGDDYRLRNMRVRTEQSGPVVQMDLGGPTPPPPELQAQLSRATEEHFGKPAGVRMTYRHETTVAQPSAAPAARPEPSPPADGR